MKNRMLKGIALSIMAVMIIACNKKEEVAVVAATPTVDPVQIKTEIQAMETAFADGMNAQKSDDIVYYADDATSFSQNKPPLVGKEAIYKGMKEEAASAPKGSKVAFTTNEVHPSADGNQVVELGSYKVSDATNAVKFSGNFMALFEKRDGKYVCIRDMSSSDQPKEEKK